jgi:Protein of unknown function (DUF1236)
MFDPQRRLDVRAPFIAKVRGHRIRGAARSTILRGCSAALLAVIALGLGSGAGAHAQSFGAITAEQRARIERHVAAESRPSVAAPLNFSLAVGATLPPGVELYWMSPAVELNRYRYAVVDGRTLIVVPYTRRIVAILD